MELSSYKKYLEANLSNYVDILEKMVSINSFTSNPQGVNQLGNWTADLFAKFGLDPVFVQSDNPNFGKHLFLRSASLQKSAQSSGQRPVISFVSHLDTVFSNQEEAEQDFHFRIDNDRLYGPGTYDCKGGTVMAFIILDALQHNDPDLFDTVDWVVALDASEEVKSEDFCLHCIDMIPSSAKACLVLEGGAPDPDSFSCVVSRKGHAEFRLEATGRGAHAGNFHHQGANAIVQLADTIMRISQYTDYSQQLTFNVGVVAGGDVPNRVPSRAEARAEMRAFAPDIFKAGIDRMLQLDGRSTIQSSDGFPCRVKVELCSSTNPWPENPATENLLNRWAAAGKSLGVLVSPELRSGISDGNLLWHKLPVLDGLGPMGGNAHCSERSSDGSKDQEYALKSSFVPKALLNLAGILDLIVQ